VCQRLACAVGQSISGVIDDALYKLTLTLTTFRLLLWSTPLLRPWWIAQEVMCSLNVRRGMVACECRITSAYLQLYLQTNIDIISWLLSYTFHSRSWRRCQYGHGQPKDPDMRRRCFLLALPANHISYPAPFLDTAGHLRCHSAARYLIHPTATLPTYHSRV